MANQDQSNPSGNTDPNPNRRNKKKAQRAENLGSERSRGSDESIRNRSDEGENIGNRRDSATGDRMHDPSRLPE